MEVHDFGFLVVSWKLCITLISCLLRASSLVRIEKLRHPVSPGMNDFAWKEHQNFGPIGVECYRLKFVSP